MKLLIACLVACSVTGCSRRITMAEAVSDIQRERDCDELSRQFDGFVRRHAGPCLESRECALVYVETESCHFLSGAIVKPSKTLEENLVVFQGALLDRCGAPSAKGDADLSDCEPPDARTVCVKGRCRFR